MKITITKITAAMSIAALALLARSAAQTNKSYTPGAYGKQKVAPMFICWREWDGEIRMGGVHKAGSMKADLDDFAVEIEGQSGSANWEHLMFGSGTTNIILNTNYTGTVQIGTNFLKASELRKAGSWK